MERKERSRSTFSVWKWDDTNGDTTKTRRWFPIQQSRDCEQRATNTSARNAVVLVAFLFMWSYVKISYKLKWDNSPCLTCQELCSWHCGWVRVFEQKGTQAVTWVPFYSWCFLSCKFLNNHQQHRENHPEVLWHTLTVANSTWFLWCKVTRFQIHEIWKYLVHILQISRKRC